ncbi:DUF4236 domain-containing protein [Sphingomonas sp. ID1715]|uniref:DUF4236 domain-containing protein n=1 Tax=Sphingomonas sp. ID1715 TaxID=1656898 RepID=UPI0014881307|nr:DUF4236 domain-containing protein [Sphingomonas sp. ID1715]NNM78624.1 DUF4236 domain-containing protein [Sphingomonas sp. ID1715]
MGFRFRRSVKLLPGVRLNFSTRGVSTSIGGRGATMNISRRGVRSTLGIPGTGLSYTTPLQRFGGTASGSPPVSVSIGSVLVRGILSVVALLLIGSCVLALSDRPASDAASAAAPVVGPTNLTRTVAAAHVNCRASPKTGAVSHRLERGEVIGIVEQSDGWSKVAQTGGFCLVSDSLLR